MSDRSNDATKSLPADSLLEKTEPRAELASEPVQAIAGYEILEEIGRGGWGVVYKARQASLDRLVALKMLLHADHASEEERLRFEREAQAIAKLKHPNIIEIHEVGEHDGKPFFSLELVSGGDLDQKLDGTPLPPEEAAQLVETLARAIEVAHRHHVVHRDLKPANVLLTEDGTPKITDFGLAKKLDEVGQTQSGAIVGTPSYLAPEQAGAKQCPISPATDVYALGAILYECLTGRPPFKAATMMSTVLQVLTEEPVAPCQLQRGIPKDLETICLKCLEKEPPRRYTSTEALAEELRRFQNGEPIKARSIGALGRLRKWARRRPAIAALVSLTLLLMVALPFGGFYYVRKIEAEEQQKEANRLRARAEKSEAEARRQRDRAERLVYANQINYAHQLWKEGDTAKAWEVLQRARWDFRHWEYRYLTSLFNPITFKGHNRGIASVAFSPDGQRIASGSEDKTVKVWDAVTGQELLTLTGHKTGVTSVTFSPDSGQIVSGSGDKTVKVWDAVTGNESFTLKGHTSQVHCVAFSPDGKRIASGSGFTEPPQIKVWDAVKGRETLTLEGHTLWVNSLAFCPDSKRIVSGGQDKTMRVWDAETGKALLVHKGHAREILSVAYSPDGRRIVSGSVFQAKVWDATTAQAVLRLEWNVSRLTSVTFSPDSRKILGIRGGRTIKVWSAVTGREMLNIKGRPREFVSVAFCPHGRRIVSGGGDHFKHGKLKMWDGVTGQEAHTLKGHTGRVNCVAFSPDSRLIASGGQSRVPMGRSYKTVAELRIWDAESKEEVVALNGHTSAVTSVAFSPDGRRIASGSWDKTVKVWSTRTWQETCTFKGHSVRVLSVAFSPDGRRIVSGGSELDRKSVKYNIISELKVWDATSGQELLNLQGHCGRVHNVVFSPDGKRIISGSEGPDRKSRELGEYLKLWDAVTGHELLTLRTDRGSIGYVALSPDGMRIATGATRLGKVWDTITGQELLTLEWYGGSWRSVAFDPDGRRIVSADGAIRVWDAVTGQETLTLGGGDSVAFSPDGLRIISGRRDGTVKLWDVRTRQVARILNVRASTVEKAGFSADGRHVVAVIKNGEKLVWDAKTGQRVRGITMNVSPAKLFSPDGKYRVVAKGTEVQLVPLQPAAEKVLAEHLQRLLPTPHWHLEQARESVKGKQWFAAAFHWHRLLKMQPWRVEVLGQWIDAQMRYRQEESEQRKNRHVPPARDE